MHKALNQLVMTDFTFYKLQRQSTTKKSRKAAEKFKLKIKYVP